MSISKEFRSRWFFSSLYLITALFFVAALLFSALNYVRVMNARENIILTGAAESATVLENGTLVVGLSIEVRNPSSMSLSVATLSWTVQVSTSGTSFIAVANAYKGPTEQLIVGKDETKTIDYTAYVTDPRTLEKIEEFINASASEGKQYTLETVPYIHDFRLAGWLGDFRHDYPYSGETYLNDMVEVDRQYYKGEYL